MERILKIILDLTKGPSYDLGTVFTQNDSNTHYLQLEFKDKELNLVGKKIRINFIRADGKVVFRLTDINSEIIKILVPTNALEIPGDLGIEITLIDEDKFLTINKIIKLKVLQTVTEKDTELIPSDDLVNDLNDLMTKIVELTVQKANEELEKLSISIKNEITTTAESKIEEISSEGEKQVKKIIETGSILSEKIGEVNQKFENFKIENETQHQELADEIRTAKTEPIPATRLEDNSISSSKLKTSTDKDKIKMINLSDEVKQAMSGNSPVTPTLTEGSIVREYIADGAVNGDKIENHTVSHKELTKDISTLVFPRGANILNPNTMTPNARLKNNGDIETFPSGSSYTISDYMYVAPYDVLTVDHRKSSNITNDYLGCWYDSNKQYIREVEWSDYTSSDDNKDIIKIPEKACYYRRSFWLNTQKSVLVGSVAKFEIKKYDGVKEFTDNNFYIDENKLKYAKQNDNGVYLMGNGSTYQYIHTPLRVYLDTEKISIDDKIKINLDLSTDNKNVIGIGYAVGGHQTYKLYTKYSQIETISQEITVQRELIGKKNTWIIIGLYHSAKGIIGDGILSNINIEINNIPVNISYYSPETIYGFKRYSQVAFNQLDHKTRAILDSLEKNGLSQDSWRNIKWATVGDSITESNFRALKNYRMLIPELTGIQVTSTGSSGTGYWGPTDGYGFFNQLSKINDGDYDIITIFGSPNDRYRFLTKKGEILDNLDGKTLNPTSYCGQVNQCYNLISKKFIKTKVLVIGPLPTSYDNYYDELLKTSQKNPIGGEGYCMREMDETLEKLCAIWNIPYLSLFKKGLLKPWIPEQNEAFFKQDGVGRPNYNPDAEPDGLHPNTEGHMVIVPIILSFLKEHIAIEKRDKTGVDNFYIPTNNTLDNLSIKDALNVLNSQMYREQMEQLGILSDYDTYMQDKASYDKHQEDLEIIRSKAFTEVIIKDPTINYDAWLKQLPMILPIYDLKPEIPQSIIEFIDNINKGISNR